MSSFTLLLLRLLWPPLDRDLLLKRDLLLRLLSLLRGDLLLLLGDLLRLNGERDLLLMGDLLLLRVGDHLLMGLASFDRSHLLRISSRGRVLGEESRLLSGSLRFLSKDRLLALLPGDRVREGDLLCLDLLSLRSGDLLLLDLSRCFGDKLLLLGLRPGLLLGDLFSFPEEASFEGDLIGFFSFSISDRFDFLSLDLDLLSLDLSLKSTGDLDFLDRSRLLSFTMGDFFLSFILPLSSILSFSSVGDLAFPIFSWERRLRGGDFDFLAWS